MLGMDGGMDQGFSSYHWCPRDATRLPKPPMHSSSASRSRSFETAKKIERSSHDLDRGGIAPPMEPPGAGDPAGLDALVESLKDLTAATAAMTAATGPGPAVGPGSPGAAMGAAARIRQLKADLEFERGLRQSADQQVAAFKEHVAAAEKQATAFQKHAAAAKQEAAAYKQQRARGGLRAGGGGLQAARLGRREAGGVLQEAPRGPADADGTGPRDDVAGGPPPTTPSLSGTGRAACRAPHLHPVAVKVGAAAEARQLPPSPGWGPVIPRRRGMRGPQESGVA